MTLILLSKALISRYISYIPLGSIPHVRARSSFKGDLNFDLLLLRGWYHILIYRVSDDKLKLKEQINLSSCGLVPERAFILLRTSAGSTKSVPESGKILVLGVKKGEDERSLISLKLSEKTVNDQETCGVPINLKIQGAQDLLTHLKMKDLSLDGFTKSLIILADIKGEGKSIPVLLRGEFNGKTVAIKEFWKLSLSCSPKRLAYSRPLLALSCGEGIYLFKLRDGTSSPLTPAYRFIPEKRDVRYAFPALSPKGDKLAFLELRGRDTFNLMLAQLSPGGKPRVKRLTHLPPKVIIGLRPFFLSEDLLLVASDFRGGFRIYLLSLSGGQWYDLGVDASIMQWAIGVYLRG